MPLEGNQPSQSFWKLSGLPKYTPHFSGSSPVTSPKLLSLRISSEVSKRGWWSQVASFLHPFSYPPMRRGTQFWGSFLAVFSGLLVGNPLPANPFSKPLILRANPEAPRKFPRLSRSFLDLPRNDRPGGQALSLRSLTPLMTRKDFF